MNWWHRLLRRSTLDRQLEEEIADHIERQVHDYVRAGMSESEARRRAALMFGAAEAVKKKSAATRAAPAGCSMPRAACVRAVVRCGSTRHPSRPPASPLGLSIRQSRPFQLVDAVLLRPLPVAAGTLVLLGEQAGDRQCSRGTSRSFARSRKARAQRCLRIPAARGLQRHARRPRGSRGRSTALRWVLPGCWAFGRSWDVSSPARTGTGRRHGPVAVISDAFWHRQFAADPHVVGRPLELKGRIVTIIGVTPPGFFGLEPGRAIEISLPLSLQPWAMPGRLLASPSVRWLRLIGRLAPDTTKDRAAAELASRWAHLGLPPLKGSPGRSRFVLLDGAQGNSDLRAQFARPLRVLFGAVGLLLVLACVNLASLTLARNQGRAGEVTLRLALGAGRGRIVRQLFTESLVLSFVAGAAGLTLAYWASRTVVTLLSRGRTPIILTVGPDWRGLLFTTLITLLAGVLFGLWPALKASRADLQPDLQAGARTMTGSRSSRWNVLIAVQTTLSIVLVVAAALFTQKPDRAMLRGRRPRQRQVMIVTVGAGMAGTRTPRLACSVISTIACPERPASAP